MGSTTAAKGIGSGIDIGCSGVDTKVVRLLAQIDVALAKTIGSLTSKAAVSLLGSILVPAVVPQSVLLSVIRIGVGCGIVVGRRSIKPPGLTAE